MFSRSVNTVGSKCVPLVNQCGMFDYSMGHTTPFCKKKKIYRALFTHFDSQFKKKNKLVNDCSDDNLIVVLWHFSDLGQSCVLPIVYTCSQVAKTTGVGIGSNTFKYLQIRTVIIAIFVRCVAPYSI